jgi:hypothetical protein
MSESTEPLEGRPARRSIQGRLTVTPRGRPSAVGDGQAVAEAERFAGMLADAGGDARSNTAGAGHDLRRALARRSVVHSTTGWYAAISRFKT